LTATLLSVVKPFFGSPGVRTAGRTVMSHSGEDMLLLSHALAETLVPRAVGRRVAGKSVPEDDSIGVSQTHGQGSAARKVVVHLAGDVALEKADDVSL
jgi:hypothetical protein